MRILVDTNICLDILQKRPGLFQSSRDALILASNKGYKLYITTATVMDIMYITRKFFSDNVQQRVTVEGFVAAFKLLKISKKDIQYAFSGVMKDFEDAVQAKCAKIHGIKLIITRNIKDFVNSPVKAVTPEDFLNIH